MYNLLYHFLRASHQHKFLSPSKTRAGADYLDKAKEVLGEMEENVDLLGGLRVETTLAATTLEEAFELYQEASQHEIRTFLDPMKLQIWFISVANYLTMGKPLLNTAINELRRWGVSSRHIITREL